MTWPCGDFGTYRHIPNQKNIVLSFILSFTTIPVTASRENRYLLPFHRITEWLRVEGMHGDHLVQLHALEGCPVKAAQDHIQMTPECYLIFCHWAHWKKSGSVAFALSLNVFINIGNIFPECNGCMQIVSSSSKTSPGVEISRP